MMEDININNCSIIILSIFILLHSTSGAVMMSVPNYTVQPILKTNICDLGEGPHYHPETESLFYVDAFLGDVHRFNIPNEQDDKINLGDLVTIVIPIQNEPDHFLVSLRNKIAKLNWINKTWQILAECAPEHEGRERFNDGKIDAKGRLWIGTVLEGPNGGGVVQSGGSLYKLDLVNKRFFKMWWNFTLSNGMAWNKNNTLMYFNDSEDRKTWLFDFDLDTGTINNIRLFLDLDQHSQTFALDEYPDGMAIDSEDFLWIAMYNGGRVVRLHPQTGQLMQSISVPAKRTTSLAFGGPHLDIIFMTSGSNKKNETNECQQERQEHAGRLFKIDFNQKLIGTKAFNFKI